MKENHISRRNAVKALAISTVGASIVAGKSLLAKDKTSKIPGPGGHSLRLGLATYSLRDMSVDDLIEAMKVLRLTNAGPFKTHFDWKGSAAGCRATAAKFYDAGFRLTGSGVFYLTDDESEMNTAFTNARAAGLDLMVASAPPDALPRLEKFVKKFDQRVGLHNHGPEDPVYPSPADIWTAIQSFDERIGICLDIAHTNRAGDDPIEMINLCAPRLYDLHIRDSVAPVGAMKDIPVEVGSGDLDIVGVLSTLMNLRYTGVVSLEYGKKETVMAGVSESVGYIRGALAGLKYT